MCGIAGIVGPGASQMRDRAEAMVRALRHRGPDASGVMAFPGKHEAILGHARLSIVDLAGGAQPMAADAIAVTFNGEIYGYKELKRTLQDYTFRTASDTEVLLALYKKYGDRMPEHLPGMFAFGLFDDASGTLLLARDRFGEKPLYWAPYHSDRGVGLVFASEIKAILASGLVEGRTLNRDALAHYLQYLYVHPQQTIYEQVHTLAPGSMLMFREGSVPIVRRYWQLPAMRENISLEDAAGALGDRFRRAVERQLAADVPVGAFLSGGLDSSTVVALAARLRREAGAEPLGTFSFRFRGATGEGDESGHALAVAAMHGTQHHLLEDSDAAIADLLAEMAGVYDEPFADSSNIATWLISRQARQHAKVVLTGDGGDELLAGYPWYRELPGHPDDESPDIAEARLSQTRYFSEATLQRFGLGCSTMRKRLEREEGTLDDALRMDLLDYMPGDILVKIDRASMAHGLELRAPFLDVELATFLIGLPPELKLHEGVDKRVFRKAFEALWPAGVRRRGKQGFGAPVAEWLSRERVRALVKTRLCDPRHPLFALMPFDATRIAVDRQNTQTWILLTLALWLEAHPI